MITVLNGGVTIEELRKIVPVTPVGAGRRWRPIQHGELVDVIKDEVRTRGWLIAEERYSVAHDGADMVGALLFDHVRGAWSVPDGLRLGLGFLNSNARRKALRLTVGAEVVCCANGLCTDSILLNRVHDHTINLIDEIEVAVGKYVDAAGRVAGIVEGLQAAVISQSQASDIIMEAGRRGYIGWAAVGRVDREYRHAAFVGRWRNTSWALLNAFTFAARRNIPPIRQMETYEAFRQMLPSGH